MHQRIRARVRELMPRVVEIRRAIHSHPELGGHEQATSDLVARVLGSAGVPVTRGIAGTGVVGLIEGRDAGPTIALRADMDALPIQDQKSVDYASRVSGVMHACGHDGHTAALVGTGIILSELASELSGNVKLIFQPAEEGPGGAKAMIEAGVLREPDVDVILGVHVWSQIPVGMVGFSPGPAYAAVDEIRIKVMGNGGHGAAPHFASDAITASAQVITALQQIVSRQVDPVEPAVVTIGTIKGGYTHNVIADTVEMTGTVRTFSAHLRAAMPGMITRVAQGVARALGADASLEYIQGYPAAINDPKVTAGMADLAARVFGENRVVRNVPRCMGGEDFAYFLQQVPGTFIVIGAGNCERGMAYPHHHPKFDFDEEALAVTMEMLVCAVSHYLGDRAGHGEESSAPRLSKV
ncbi:MAG: amidohydrolase [Firmicutes bacterium]|nr:amidohydrolase [Bacillota bacterium]